MCRRWKTDHVANVFPVFGVSVVALDLQRPRRRKKLRKNESERKNTIGSGLSDNLGFFLVIIFCKTPIVISFLQTREAIPSVAIPWRVFGSSPDTIDLIRFLVGIWCKMPARERKYTFFFSLSRTGKTSVTHIFGWFSSSPWISVCVRIFDRGKTFLIPKSLAFFLLLGKKVLTKNLN